MPRGNSQHPRPGRDDHHVFSFGKWTWSKNQERVVSIAKDLGIRRDDPIHVDVSGIFSEANESDWFWIVLNEFPQTAPEVISTHPKPQHLSETNTNQTWNPRHTRID
jgi:hypothetical protein